MTEMKRLKQADHDRIINSSRNIVFSVIGQILVAVMGLIERSFFLSNLSSDYLGLNSLFSSILSFLSLTELGLGTAFAYSLYGPLADGDDIMVRTLMKYFSRAYRLVGLAIFSLGVCLLPFLGIILKTDIALADARFYYILYLVGVTGSYLFSANEILIEADQKLYINTIVGSCVQLGLYTMQILILVYTRNFAYYLIAFAIATIGKYFFMYLISFRVFPFLRNREKTERLDTQFVKGLYRNLRALMLNKIGGVISSGSDSILISMLVSTAALGIYSNYMLIFVGVGSGTAILFTSVKASIGNLCAIESPKKSYIWFRRINAYYGFLIGLVYTVLAVCSNPLLKALYPQAEVFSSLTAVLLSLTRYFGEMRAIITNYEDAYGLFRQDRYKTLVSAILNIACSIFFVKVFNLDVAGIALGTVFSQLFVYSWLEPLILHRYGFLNSTKGYWFQYIKSVLTTLISIGLGLWGCSLVPFGGRFAVILDICLVVAIYTCISVVLMPKQMLLFWRLVKKRGRIRKYEKTI